MNLLVGNSSSINFSGGDKNYKCFGRCVIIKIDFCFVCTVDETLTIELKKSSVILAELAPNVWHVVEDDPPVCEVNKRHTTHRPPRRQIGYPTLRTQLRKNIHLNFGFAVCKRKEFKKYPQNTVISRHFTLQVLWLECFTFSPPNMNKK